MITHWSILAYVEIEITWFLIWHFGIESKTSSVLITSVVCVSIFPREKYHIQLLGNFYSPWRKPIFYTATVFTIFCSKYKYLELLHIWDVTSFPLLSSRQLFFIMTLRNFDNYLPIDTISHPRRLESSTMPEEPHICSYMQHFILLILRALEEFICLWRWKMCLSLSNERNLYFLSYLFCKFIKPLRISKILSVQNPIGK